MGNGYFKIGTKVLQEEEDIQDDSEVNAIRERIKINPMHCQKWRNVSLQYWRCRAGYVEIGTKVLQAEDKRNLNKQEEDSELLAVREQIRINPMTVDLVLEKIFDYCTVSTLKHCRLVCQKWKDVSLKYWRRRAVFKLTAPSSLSSWHYMPLQNYRELVEQSNGKDYEDLQLGKYRFRNFVLESVYSLPSVDDLEPISHARHLSLQNFSYFDELKSAISKFECLESLELASFSVMNLRVGTVLEEESSKKFWKVKRLRLSEPRFTSDDQWNSLFQLFPNLETVRIDYYKHATYAAIAEPLHQLQENFHTLLAVLREVKLTGGGGNLNLKELDIIDMPRTDGKELERNRRDTAIVRAIIDCRFPLERLSIHFGWISNRGLISPPMKKVLNHFKDTLQYLRIHVPLPVYALRFRIYLRRKDDIKIHMPNLRKISLVNGLPYGLFLLAHMELPKLVKLKVEFDGESWRKIESDQFRLYFPEDRVYEKLECFEFLENHRTPCADTIKTFIGMMPNLVHLTIPLDKITFKLVCKHLRGLKTLNVLAAKCRYVELDDETLTGVSKDDVDYRKQQKPREPNITDLALLSDLSISCENQLRCQDVKFTDHSVIYGFLKLPRLHSLSIAFHKISDHVKAKLLDHVKGHVHFQTKFENLEYRDYFDVEVSKSDIKSEDLKFGLECVGSSSSHVSVPLQ